MGKVAVVVGAGPAGLTAAYELIAKTKIKPVVLELADEVGGLAKTVNYRGNKIDIGGHRFFSKSDKVMKWWLNILPLQGFPAKDDLLLNRELSCRLNKNNPDPERTDKVMLFRNRFSRIYYLNKLFDYPISLSSSTLKNLGFFRTFSIGISYLNTKLFPKHSEKTLEDFMINRFGKVLYSMFFKDYTHKIWGKWPSKIQADWGAQRIKGVSVSKVVANALGKIFIYKNSHLNSKNSEASLIEHFIYPKLGPGQLWDQVAKEIIFKKGKIYLHSQVIGIHKCDGKIISISFKNLQTNKIETIRADYVISSMPIKDLITSMGKDVPEKVSRISRDLPYRNFITVGLLLKKLKIKNNGKIKTINNIIPDLWLYIQEKNVKMARMQIYNNWSPYLVKDFKNSVWVGVEYIVGENDKYWHKSESDIKEFAIKELTKINFIEKKDILDSCVIKFPKAYPGYFGSYQYFDTVKTYLNQFTNLFLIGRNGMHRYNNMDHSILSAMAAVENIAKGVLTKNNIWSVNEDKEYHEIK